MSGLLGVPLGAAGSARARYGRAMQMWAAGALSPAQLEGYRVAAADDLRPPSQVLGDRGLPLPGDAALAPGAAIADLVTEADLYLAELSGPGVAEARAGLARWRGGPVMLAVGVHAVVEAHLAMALAAMGDHPGLAGAIAAAAPHLAWRADERAEGGAGFAQGHAYVSLLGQDQSSIPAEGFDFGLFLMAPHVLYRDHARAAAELSAPLTGPHGWRFGAGRPLVIKPAHLPVWTPAHQPHLTKVGPLPYLGLYARTRDVMAPAHVIAAQDWPELERLRLG